MNDEIAKRLKQIEQRNSVRLLYACESGSRAWGFASSDSDYDVRFIYIHPKSWYLSVDLERRRDVIELPIEDDLDMNGWDLRKALALLGKSNPSLLEWLRSPIVYFQRSGVLAGLRSLSSSCFSSRACIHHYLSMANNNHREYLRGSEVSLKKYFYVLRPVLAIRWIESGKGPPPVEFDELVDELVTDPTLLASIRELEQKKRAGTELDVGPRIPEISDFLEQELARLADKKGEARPDRPSTGDLDEFFRKTIDEVWATETAH